ncbi:helix-turn-helix domain-containing protein [[Clostridium] aminophilum]|uniref:helix-turn-helix domain-containing protein n=1 Tax=[Clostridium] aminophilum TaxID=1526 RepID=UPI003F9EA145
MTGYEYLKEKRKEKQYSVRGFAALCDISPRTITYYESGEKSISSISLSKALRYFDLLGIDLESFFKTYYPSIETDLKEKVLLWRRDHEREYDLRRLKHKYYVRLTKIKERDSIPLRELDRINNLYKNVFMEQLSKNDTLTDQDYDQYILELNYQIRCSLSADETDKGNRITAILLDALYHTEYSISDLSKFCGVTAQHLRNCFGDVYDIQKIQLSLALRLCSALGLSFDRTFRANVSI